MFINFRLKLTAGLSLRLLAVLALVSGVAYAWSAHYVDYVTDNTLREIVTQAFDERDLAVPEGLVNAESALQLISQIEDAYDGEDSVDFILPLDENARIMLDKATQSDLPTSLTPTDLAGVRAARDNGVDWRTMYVDGIHMRLLTVALPRGAPMAFLQTGKVLSDDDRIKHQVLLVLFVFIVTFALLAGGSSWLETGRTLRSAQDAWNRQLAFVANASHELKTPLTLVRASAQVVQRSLAASDVNRQLLDDVVTETDYMSKLIDELLLLSRLDVHQLKLNLSPILLTDWLPQIVRQFMPFAIGRGVSISVNHSEGMVLADPVRLRQILLIVIDNALRHTPVGGDIVLDSCIMGDSICMSVTDTGEGIEPDELPRVFERFYKVNEGRGNWHSAGLGLSIAKPIVELHDGAMNIESSLGIGTRVTITLPAQTAHDLGTIEAEQLADVQGHP